MTSLALELGRTVLSWLFVIYTVVAVSHYLLQLVFAHRTYRWQGSAAFVAAFPDGTMDVDIIVPSYNEEPALLEACVRSAFAQDHLGHVRVIVVDDGSPKRASLDATYDRLEADGAVVIRSPRNVGKRHAQALALPHCEGEIIVTVDSDTVLAPDAIRRLTRQFSDPRVGAATGFVDVLNDGKNFLTRIQRIRYWMAFKQERAAQSWFRTVLCCSGPLAAYRRSVIEQVAPAYLSQYYGGVACTFGDDRHLTNLVLGAGYDTVFDAGAVAYTNVPENLRQFLKQQLRWSKSFYRELVWTIPFIGRRPWYSRFDVACLVAMPMMLTLTAGFALLFGVMISPLYLLRFAAFITLAAGVRITYAAVRERDPRMYFFILYGFVSAFLLMSVRLVALSTLTDARWGTRGPAGAGRSWSEPLARLRSAVQPASLAVATATWPASAPTRLMPVVNGGPPQFDGAWRAGVSMKMMVHPASSSLTAGRPIAVAMAPTFAPSVGSGDQPLGPICGHAARPGARFCRVCGASYALVTGEVSATVAEPAVQATFSFTPRSPRPSSMQSDDPAEARPSQPDPIGLVDSATVSPASSVVTSAEVSGRTTTPGGRSRPYRHQIAEPAAPPLVSPAKPGRRGTPRAATPSATPPPARKPARSRAAATPSATSPDPIRPAAPA